MLAVNTLQEFTNRVNALRARYDPREADKLYKWVEQGGMDGLHNGLVQFLRQSTGASLPGAVALPEFKQGVLPPSSPIRTQSMTIVVPLSPSSDTDRVIVMAAPQGGVAKPYAVFAATPIGSLKDIIAKTTQTPVSRLITNIGETVNETLPASQFTSQTLYYI